MSYHLLVGTTKGAFIIKSDDRVGWTVDGPFCDGWPINHMERDPVTGRLWAAGGNAFFGAGVWSRETNGTWSLTKLAEGEIDQWAAQDPDFAKMIGWTEDPAPFSGQVDAIWSLRFTYGRLYAGTKPAQLLQSDDHGETWQMNAAMKGFPDRESWNPGAAGMILHTIVPDPQNAEKLWLCVSAAGVFATENGGESWERRNRLSNADDCGHHDHPAAPKDGETGHCVHNMVRAAGSDLLYQQNHHGVWRSPDGGRTWSGINDGLPSTFGFPITLHPRDDNTIWTIPLNGDSQGRYPPDARAAVWKSSDGGATWVDKRSGLPGQNCYFTVLRQAMSNDQSDPVGLYFGTNSGSIFASCDEGESWEEIVRHLPTILSVEARQSA